MQEKKRRSVAWDKLVVERRRRVLLRQPPPRPPPISSLIVVTDSSTVCPISTTISSPGHVEVRDLGHMNSPPRLPPISSSTTVAGSTTVYPISGIVGSSGQVDNSRSRGDNRGMTNFHSETQLVVGVATWMEEVACIRSLSLLLGLSNLPLHDGCGDGCVFFASAIIDIREREGGEYGGGEEREEFGLEEICREEERRYYWRERDGLPSSSVSSSVASS